MSKPDHTLLLEIGFIVHADIGYSRTFEFEFAHLNVDGDLDINEVGGQITISRTRDGLLTQANFTGTIEATCVRCLEVAYPNLDCEFSELFTLHSQADAHTELVVPANGKIDFGPIVREYMLLEVPMNTLCRPDCKGLCPQCGSNRNDQDCGHSIAPVDARFSALQSLLDDQQKDK